MNWFDRYERQVRETWSRTHDAYKLIVLEVEKLGYDVGDLSIDIIADLHVLTAELVSILDPKNSMQDIKKIVADIGKRGLRTLTNASQIIKTVEKSIENITGYGALI